MTDCLRIAMIGHKQVPSREGGVEVVVQQLASRMADRGHQVEIYNRLDLFSDKAKHRTREYNGVRIIWVPTLSNPGINAFLYSLFATLAAMFRTYDVLHYHAIGSCAMLFLPRLFGRRTVVTIHGLDWQRSKWGAFATRYLLFAERCAARYADEIIVLSDNVQKYFLQTYSRQTCLLANGVESAVPIPASIIRDKHGLEKNTYILYLARIVPEKGLHYLIEAYQGLDTPTKLVVAGRLEASNAYVKMIRERASACGNIIFTGFVEGDELRELYSNCILYVLPSDVEGMPISLLEAISFRARCLTSDIEENTQINSEYGHIFARQDVASLRSTIQEVISAPDTEAQQKEREQLSQQILKRHDWDEVVDQTLTLYGKLAAI